MALDSLMPIVILAFGTLIGSFLNVLIWRLPREEKPNGRSRCVSCGHTLSAKDLVPVASFLFYRGRCAYCRQKISFRYPLIEITTGMLFYFTWIMLAPFEGGEWVYLARSLFVVCVLVVVFVIDLEHYLILDKIVFPATAAVLLFNLELDIFSATPLLEGLFFKGLLGAMLGFLPFYILWKASKGKWIGLGDAKFGIFIGAVLGFPLVYVGYFLAFLMGAVVSVPLLIFGKKQLTSKLPLGTFLAVGTLVAMFWGSSILDWYWGLIMPY